MLEKTATRATRAASSHTQCEATRATASTHRCCTQSTGASVTQQRSNQYFALWAGRILGLSDAAASRALRRCFQPGTLQGHTRWPAATLFTGCNAIKHTFTLQYFMHTENHADDRALHNVDRETPRADRQAESRAHSRCKKFKLRACMIKNTGCESD
jgi:hypothetical protein